MPSLHLFFFHRRMGATSKVIRTYITQQALGKHWARRNRYRFLFTPWRTHNTSTLTLAQKRENAVIIGLFYMGLHLLDILFLSVFKETLGGSHSNPFFFRWVPLCFSFSFTWRFSTLPGDVMAGLGGGSRGYFFRMAWTETRNGEEGRGFCFYSWVIPGEESRGGKSGRLGAEVSIGHLCGSSCVFVDCACVCLFLGEREDREGEVWSSFLLFFFDMAVVLYREVCFCCFVAWCKFTCGILALL